MTSTANERIITQLRKPYPRWHPSHEFGRDFHKLATRISELNRDGWDVKSRKSTRHFHESGRAEQEYRLGSLV